MLKTAIIGSGIAGIATAIRLAIKGNEVIVYEKNGYPGGKLSEVKQDGYRFDAGPSLFTMPQYVDDLFRLAGRNPADYFRYLKLETACKYFFEDGTIINAYTDQQEFATEVESKLGVASNILLNHLNHSSGIYNAVGKLFMEKSLHQLRNYLSWDTIKAMAGIHRLDLMKTLNQANESRLKHPKLVQIFNRFATYNGSNPYVAPGILNIIPNLEHNFGAFFPAGGMYSIILSLFKLAKELGVQFELNSSVEKINVSENKVNGVKVNDQLIYFDRIISNADVYPTYQYLLNGQLKSGIPHKTLNQERSSSALIFYWGIKKQFDNLDLHNIFFSEDYKEEFDHIFTKQDVYNDPTVYVNITSKYAPKDAPNGCENWFVMINVPYNRGQDWDSIIKRSRNNIIKKLSRLLKADIAGLIETEAILEPRTIESKTSSFRGSLYGSSHNDRFAAFKRHPNFSQQIKGLYFCGGSVHPGGGIPLCLLSAKIVEEVFR